jgi:minor capsid protein
MESLLTLREAISDYITNELDFTGSIFLVPFPSTKDEGLSILDKGQFNEDPIRIQQFPTIQLFWRFGSSETCRQWGETFYRAFDTGRPFQLTPTFRVGRCKTAGLPFSIGPDALGQYRRSLDLQITLRYDAEI